MSNARAIGTQPLRLQRPPGDRSAIAASDPTSEPAAVGRTEATLLLLVAVALAIRFALVSRLNVNWDEFYFLSFVHDYLRGTVASPLQTFHVHLFAWLPALFGDEISQIVAGRTVMTMLAVADAFLLYGIGCRFLTRAGALFGVLAYFSFGYVFGHGSSFRVDPVLATLLLGSLHAVLRRPGGNLGAVLAGLAAALATMVSVKSVFHLTAIGAVYLCLLVAAEVRRPVLVSAVLFAVSSAGALATLFAAHRLSLVVASSAGVADFLGGSASKMLSGRDLRLPLFYLATDYVRSLPLWALLLGGLVVARREAARTRGRGRAEKLIPFALCLPVLTLLFYRNAFPYYYALALAPGALLTGLAYDRLGVWSATFRQAWRRRAASAALIAALVAMLVVDCLRYGVDQTSVQRQVIGVVHAAFPEPVPYLDGYAMIGSFPWAGFFMSSWGMQSYRAAGRPLLEARAAAGAAPVLVIADSAPLAAALLGDTRPGIEDFRMVPEDERFLQENYLRYWGPLFVAGKRVAMPATGLAGFDILVPGNYRLDAAGPLRLDGQTLSPGAAIDLARGSHWLATEDGLAEDVVLRWAAVSPPPPALPDSCLFVVDFATASDCALPIPRASTPERAWEGSQP